MKLNVVACAAFIVMLSPLGHVMAKKGNKKILSPPSSSASVGEKICRPFVLQKRCGSPQEKARLVSYTDGICLMECGNPQTVSEKVADDVVATTLSDALTVTKTWVTVACASSLHIVAVNGDQEIYCVNHGGNPNSANHLGRLCLNGGSLSAYSANGPETPVVFNGVSYVITTPVSGITMLRYTTTPTLLEETRAASGQRHASSH